MRKLIQENATEALSVFLKNLKIPFSSYTIEKFKTHPEFPSLFSLSYTLSQLGIAHFALRSDYHQLQDDLPKPAIVHIRDNGGMFLVVAEVQSEGVQIINERNEVELYPKKQFLQSWSGVTLVADNSSSAREENYHQNRVKETFRRIRLPLACSSGLLLLVYWLLTFSAGYHWTYYALLFSKLTGIGLSILLLIHDFDKNHPFFKKLCSPNKKIDCSSILDSPAAKIFGLISWSEIGLVYFLTGFLFLLFFPSPINVGMVTLVSLGAAFYIPYSVYYQWKIAGSWCRLCLFVQGILAVEAALALGYWSAHDIIFREEVFISLVAFLLLLFLVSSLFGFLKPVFFEWKSLRDQMSKVRSIKFNRQVFDLLSKDMTVIHKENLRPIQFGNPEGEHILTVITNPVCEPCRKMHQTLFNLLRTKTNTRVEEIFLTEEDDQAISKRVAEAMLQLYHQLDPEAFRNALSEFYKTPDRKVEEWIQRFSMKDVSLSSCKEKAHSTLETHLNWCKKMRIFSTPRIFYNHKPLPDGYSLDDLEYLID